MFTITNISIVLLITSAVNIVVFNISWRRRNSRIGLYFALGMLAVTVWTFMSALDYAAVPLYLKIFFAKMEAVGYYSALALFALLSISYAGNDRWLEKKWVRAIFLFAPLINILLAITNELHHTIWTGFVRKANNVVVFEHGPAFSWGIVVSYALIILIFINLSMAFRKGSNFARRQTLWLVFALIFPIITNSMYQFSAGRVEGVDWTSVTFSVSGSIFLYVLYGMRFLDVIPIARDKLFNNLSDGMIVLDMQNRIIDINNVAAGIFGVPAIGQNLAQVAPLTRTALDHPPEEEVRTEITTGEIEKRYFDIRLTPLVDERKRVTGRLLFFRDITEIKQNELRLLQLTQAVEQSPLSIVMTDLDGIITYTNPQFTELTGYTPAEALGKSSRIQKSGVTPDDTYRDMWQTIKSGQVWKGELLNKKKNGELYWEQSTIAPILDHDGLIINFIALKVNITERRSVEDALRQRLLDIQILHQELQESQAQVMEQERSMATIAERQRLARDMHDSVNQSVHSLMLFSETLVALLEKEQIEKALYVANRIQESGEQALKEIRLLVYGAQSTLTDENTDLISALEERLNMVERRIGIEAEIIYDPARVRYPHAWNENLYWIVMEALNNSLKHSQADGVKVIFNGAEKQLDLEIVDDGAGFDASQIQVGGFGMRSMRERAEMLGGTLSVISSPGNGTRICFKAEMEA